MYTAKETLYIDKDGKIVPAGTPGASILIAKGGVMSSTQAKNLGLVVEETAEVNTALVSEA